MCCSLTNCVSPVDARPAQMRATCGCICALIAPAGPNEMRELQHTYFQPQSLLGTAIVRTFGSREMFEKSLTDTCMKGQPSPACIVPVPACCAAASASARCCSVRVWMVLARDLRIANFGQLEAEPGVACAKQLQAAAGYRCVGCVAAAPVCSPPHALHAIQNTRIT
jgi:hypothetical protein